MSTRTRVGWVAIVVVALGGALVAPSLGVVPTAEATVAAVGLLAVLTWPERARLAALTVGLFSLAGTVAAPRQGDARPDSLVLLGLIEVAALLAIIVLVVRVGPRSATLIAPAVVAVGLWILRVDPPTSIEIAEGCASWTALALGACGVGAYLRSLDTRREQAVAETRSEQRQHLARELHDYVAHDVSGILALAQAGRMLAAAEPDRTADILRMIEETASSALTSMDRTLAVLGDDRDGPEVHPTPPTLEGLHDVVARFAAGHPAAIQVEIDHDVPREVSTTACRVVIEALTNIRRHAPEANRVLVAVRLVADTVAIEVADDAVVSPNQRPGRRSGLGLPGIAERVRALGGTLEAGARDPVGWQVRAVLPLRASVRAGRP